jgi:DNA-binding NarL/FixJ family response regulator
VASGGTYVSPRLTRTLLAQRSGRQQDARSLDRLTRAERQVLNLLGDGGSSREIADAMCISVRTAESHRYHICPKLGTRGTQRWSVSPRVTATCSSVRRRRQPRPLEIQ